MECLLTNKKRVGTLFASFFLTGHALHRLAAENRFARFLRQDGGWVARMWHFAVVLTLSLPFAIDVFQVDFRHLGNRRRSKLPSFYTH